MSKRRTVALALFPPFAWFAAAFLATSCQTPASKPRSQTSPSGVPDEAMLKEDRAALDELRKGEPEEVRRQNDELALLLDVMKDGTTEPSAVRDRYNKIVRDKRDRMDKRLRKAREAFDKSSRKNRDEFTKALAKDRARFVARRHKQDESKEFFDEQDQKRKSWYDEEKEKRQTFEADVTEQRKGFEDYVREKTNWFNSEMRGYSTAYYERQKAQGQKKDMAEKERRMKRESEGAGATSGALTPEQKRDLEDFRAMPQTPAAPLQSGEADGR